MDACLSIIVYRGDPVDLRATRHTALLLTFDDNTTTLIHATGAPGFFQVETTEQVQPRKSTRFAKAIDVAKITGMSKDLIRSTIAATPTVNNTRDWDCQKWVGDVLTKLSNLGWIDPTARSNGISHMVDATMEAVDEE